MSAAGGVRSECRAAARITKGNLSTPFNTPNKHPGGGTPVSGPHQFGTQDGEDEQLKGAVGNNKSLEPRRNRELPKFDERHSIPIFLFILAIYK